MIFNIYYIYFNSIWVVPQKNKKHNKKIPPETACEFVDLSNLCKSTTYIYYNIPIKTEYRIVCVLCVCVIRISIKTQSLEKKTKKKPKNKRDQLDVCFSTFCLFVPSTSNLIWILCVSIYIFLSRSLCMCLALYLQ